MPEIAAWKSPIDSRENCSPKYETEDSFIKCLEEGRG
jgi:hypothetical protein